MPALDEFSKRLENIVEGFTKELTLECQQAVDKFFATEENVEVYAFVVSLAMSNFDIRIFINTEPVWEKGYGSVEYADPNEESLKGMRFQDIDYSRDDFDGSGFEMKDLADDIYDEKEKCEEIGDIDAEQEFEKFSESIDNAFYDVVVNAVLNTDFSKLNKTQNFCAFALNHSLPDDDSYKLVLRTVSDDIAKNIATVFPENKPVKANTIIRDILSFPEALQMEKLIEYIIHHEMNLDYFNRSSQYSDLLSACSRLMQLRPTSDLIIAKTINEYISKIKIYNEGSDEFKENGSFSKENTVIYSVMSGYHHSSALITPELEDALNNYLAFLMKHEKEGIDCDAMDIRNALKLWRVG